MISFACRVPQPLGPAVLIFDRFSSSFHPFPTELQGGEVWWRTQLRQALQCCSATEGTCNQQLPSSELRDLSRSKLLKESETIDKTWQANGDGDSTWQCSLGFSQDKPWFNIHILSHSQKWIQAPIYKTSERKGVLSTSHLDIVSDR